jgi:hypothetical protein
LTASECGNNLAIENFCLLTAQSPLYFSGKTTTCVALASSFVERRLFIGGSFGLKCLICALVAYMLANDFTQTFPRWCWN